MYIYKTICLINNKIYIGQCIKTPQQTKSYLGSGTIILQAIKKYGKENFVKEILKDNIKNQKLLDSWKMIYIRKFNSCCREIGYNIIPGTVNEFGSGSPMLIEEVKLKVLKKVRIIVKSKAFKDKASMIRSAWWEKPENKKYKKQYAESGKKLKGELNPNYGNFWTEEQKQRMRDLKNSIDSYGKNNPNYGNKWTDDQKKRLSEKRKMINKLKGNPMSGMVRITNGKKNTIIKKGDSAPDGWRFGLTQKRKIK